MLPKTGGVLVRTKVEKSLKQVDVSGWRSFQPRSTCDASWKTTGRSAPTTLPDLELPPPVPVIVRGEPLVLTLPALTLGELKCK